MDKKVPRPVEAFIIIILSLVFVVSITQILIELINPGSNLEIQNTLIQKLLSNISQLGFLILPVLYLKSKKLDIRKIFRIKRITSNIILWSIVAGVCISVLTDEMDRLMQLVIPAPEYLIELTDSLKINSISDLILLSLGMIVIAPVTEEALIRGFLQSSLEEHLDVTRAVIYASLAWTIIHFMWYWAIQLLLMGVLFGLLVWKSRSLWPAVIGHAANNGIGLLLANMEGKNLPGFFFWGKHYSPIIVGLSLAGIYYCVKIFYLHYASPSASE